jgi:hypothetical protein
MAAMNRASRATLCMSSRRHEPNVSWWMGTGLLVAALWTVPGCGGGEEKSDDTLTSGPSGTSSGGSAGRGSGANIAGIGGTNSGRAGAPSMAGAGAEDPFASAGTAGLAQVPPPPGPDGSSPYVRECRGDTRDCGGDPRVLRCLGLRDGTEVFGYGCSNPCQTEADCSTAPSGVEASAGCVDFVSAKHCLLVCLEGTQQRECPAGMSCYVYPGSEIGYCLWR